MPPRRLVVAAVVVAADEVPRENIPVVPVVEAGAVLVARERPVVAGVAVLVAPRVVVGNENEGLVATPEVVVVAGLLARPNVPEVEAKVILVVVAPDAVVVAPVGLKLKLGVVDVGN